MSYCEEIRRARTCARGFCLAVLIVTGVQSGARAAEPPEEEGGMSIEEISRMLDNPLGNLWIIFMQNDMMRLRGDPPTARSGRTS